MTRIKLVLLSAVAAMAISAVGSAAASAAKCSAEAVGTIPVWCVGGETFYNKTETTETVQETSFKLEGVPANIACTTLKATGKIIQKELVAGEDESSAITFTGCTVEGQPNCTVGSGETAGTIVTEPTNTLLEEISEKVYDRFTPKSGSVFVTLKIKNVTGKVCNAKGEFKVTENTCGEVGPEATLGIIKFSLAIAEACKSTLTFGGSPASLEGESGTTLTSKKAFGVILVT